MKSVECRMPGAKTGGLLVLSFCTHHFAFRNELVEPEVVATSPYRVKNPVPVCCGFDSLKLVGERGLASRHGGTHRFSICGVCCSRLTTRPTNGASEQMQNRKTPPGLSPYSAFCILHFAFG